MVNPSTQVLVWDTSTGALLAELRGGHGAAVGIRCVRLSTDGRTLASATSSGPSSIAVGDGRVNVWSWRTGFLIASVRLKSAAINTILFSNDGMALITAGSGGHLRHWELGPAQDAGKCCDLRGVRASLDGGPEALLNTAPDYIDAAIKPGPSQSPMYVLTSDGHLLLFGGAQSRALHRWVDLGRAPAAGRPLAVSAVGRFVACACEQALVRLFDPTTLQYLCTLPKPPPIQMMGGTVPGGHPWPDAKAVSLTADGQRAACLYGDRGLFVWDLRDPARVCRCRALRGHEAGVWDVDAVPDPSATSASGLPSGSFISCSSDGSVRVWALGPTPVETEASADVLMPRSPGGGPLGHRVVPAGRELQAALRLNQDAAPMQETDDKADRGCSDSVEGRCVRISTDGQFFAVGDRVGNLRVHALAPGLEMQAFLSAHDSEVLSLDWAPRSSGEVPSTKSSLLKHQPAPLLASSGRDGFVHVFGKGGSAHAGGGLLQPLVTLDDHDGTAVAAIRFGDSGCSLVTCGGDRSVVLRRLSIHDSGETSGSLVRRLALSGADCAVDARPVGGRAAIAAREGGMAVINATTGAEICRYHSDSPIVRVRIDPTGKVAAIASADRSINIIDLDKGVSVAGPVRGHAEAVAGLAFVSDRGRLITASRDGCIFVWRLPSAVVNLVQAVGGASSHLPLSAVSTQSDSASKVRNIAEYSPASAIAKVSSVSPSNLIPAPSPGVRRPTIHDLKRSPEQQEMATSIPTQTRNQVEQRCAPEYPAQMAGQIVSSQKISDFSDAGTARPAGKAAMNSENCWAARRNGHNDSAKPLGTLDDLTIEEMDVKADSVSDTNAVNSLGQALKMSGLGEMEDDDEIDESNADNNQAVAGSRTFSLVADQEDGDFKVLCSVGVDLGIAGTDLDAENGTVMCGETVAPSVRAEQGRSEDDDDDGPYPTAGCESDQFLRAKGALATLIPEHPSGESAPLEQLEVDGSAVLLEALDERTATIDPRASIRLSLSVGHLLRRQIKEALQHSKEAHFSADMDQGVVKQLDPSLEMPDPMFYTPSSFSTPRGDASENISSANITPGGTSYLVGCRGPDAHAENRRLQREIEGMRERLQAMGMCCGLSATVGGPHPTPQERSAVVSVTSSPSKPAHPPRRGSEGTGRPVGAPKSTPFNVGESAVLGAKPDDVSCATATKLRPLPGKQIGKENVPQSATLRQTAGDENQESESDRSSVRSGSSAAAAGTSTKDQPSAILNGKAPAGPSLFAVMRTAATVKAAERADGAMFTEAAQVYKAAASALAAPHALEMTASGGVKSLREEREMLKAKVQAELEIRRAADDAERRDKFRGAKAEAELIRARLRELEERRRNEPVVRRGDSVVNDSLPNPTAPNSVSPGSVVTNCSVDNIVSLSNSEAANSVKILAPTDAKPLETKLPGLQNASLEESSLRSSLAAEAARIRAEVEAARQRAEAADRELLAAQLAKQKQKAQEDLKESILAPGDMTRESCEENEFANAQTKTGTITDELSSKSNVNDRKDTQQNANFKASAKTGIPTPHEESAANIPEDIIFADEKDLRASEISSAVEASSSNDTECIHLKSDESIICAQAVSESEGSSHKLITSAECPDEVISNEPSSCERDSLCLPDSGLCAGLVEWAKELGLTMISPVVTNTAIPVAAPSDTHRNAPLAQAAADETYADESFEKDDDTDGIQLHTVAQTDESFGLSVTSIKVWADSGPEVFEFPSGAGDIEDDSSMHSCRPSAAAMPESLEPVLNETLPVVQTSLAKEDMKCCQAITEGMFDLNGEIKGCSETAEIPLCRNAAQSNDSHLNLDRANFQQISVEEMEPRKNPPKVHQTWYSVFDDDEAAESAADEAAAYFSEMIMSMAVARLVLEAAAEVMHSMGTVASATSDGTEAAPFENQEDLRSSSSCTHTDTDRKDVDGHAVPEEEFLSENVPSQQLPTPSRALQEKSRSDSGISLPIIVQDNTDIHSPASILQCEHQYSTAKQSLPTNSVKSVLLPDTFLVGPARSEDPNHPLRFQAAGSESSFSVVDSVDSMTETESVGAGAGLLGAGEADALLSSVEAAVRALRVARASSSGPAVSAVVQALREAQGRISQVLAAVGEECPGDTDRCPPEHAAAPTSLPSAAAPAAEDPQWPPPSSGLPSARSSVSSARDGEGGDRAPGRNKLNVSLSSISGGSVEASVDLDCLLERYSDRLVGLVMEKMAMSSKSSPQG